MVLPKDEGGGFLDFLVSELDFVATLLPIGAGLREKADKLLDFVLLDLVGVCMVAVDLPCCRSNSMLAKAFAEVRGDLPTPKTAAAAFWFS